MNLLEIRRIIKSKKPHFKRQDENKRKEVSDSWRRPKGIQSKMRLRKRGHPKHVEIGYRSPEEVRGLHRNGLTQNIVRKITDLEALNAQKDGVIIARTVGLKNRLLILHTATQKGFTLLNTTAERIQKKSAAREQRAAQKKHQQKKAEPAPKPAKKQPEKAAAAEATEEDKKKAEKEEKDKILTKRDI